MQLFRVSIDTTFGMKVFKDVLAVSVEAAAEWSVDQLAKLEYRAEHILLVECVPEDPITYH